MSPKDELSGQTFRPTREGLAKILGELEAEVMEFVWSVDPEPVSAREVEDAIGEERGVQYITLLTVMNNLWRKKLLKRRKRGRAFLYQARIGRDEYLRRISREVFSGILDLGAELAVSSFVDVLEELAPAELRRLKKKLAERRKEGRQ